MMPSSACQPWPTDTPAKSAGDRNDAVGSYTTPWDTIRSDVFVRRVDTSGGWQMIATDVQDAFFECDLQHLIYQVGVGFKLVQRLLK